MHPVKVLGQDLSVSVRELTPCNEKRHGRVKRSLTHWSLSSLQAPRYTDSFYSRGTGKCAMEQSPSMQVVAWPHASCTVKMSISRLQGGMRGHAAGAHSNDAYSCRCSCRSRWASPSSASAAPSCGPSACMRAVCAVLTVDRLAVLPRVGLASLVRWSGQDAARRVTC